MQKNMYKSKPKLFIRIDFINYIAHAPRIVIRDCHGFK